MIEDTCECDLCKLIRRLGSLHPIGGWADPRRYYLESEEDFIKRVPDGFLRWPEDHVVQKWVYDYGLGDGRIEVI